MNRRLVRWIPVVAAPALLLGAAAAVPAVASAAPDLPAKTPQQILELVAKSGSITGLSGTVVQTTDLGLPTLPTGQTGPDGQASGDDQAASTLALLTGSHTLRVFASNEGDGGTRIEDLAQAAEHDVVQSGRSIWTYDSKAQTAEHVTLPTATHRRAITGGEQLTPQSAATLLLQKAGVDSTVESGGTAEIAGHDAYLLTVVPKSSTTLVGSVDVAVDATTGLPLRVQVIPRGSGSPAVDIAYTSLSYGAQPASLFDFTPPAGTTVKTVVPTAPVRRPLGMTTGAKPDVTGTGWDTVVELPKADVPSAALASPLLGDLTTTVADGRVIRSTLATVLITNDGRVFAGAVPASVLEATADR